MAGIAEIQGIIKWMGVLPLCSQINKYIFLENSKHKWIFLDWHGNGATDPSSEQKGVGRGAVSYQGKNSICILHKILNNAYWIMKFRNSDTTSDSLLGIKQQHQWDIWS